MARGLPESEAWSVRYGAGRSLGEGNISPAGQQAEVFSGADAMGDLVEFRLTKKSIYRAARREVERMYQITAGGVDPVASSESRELFEMGLVDEVKWLDWGTYCASVINRIFDGEPEA